jgi:hypothetical protein
MTIARELLDAAPVPFGLDADAVAAAIDACMVAAQACVSCGNSCLAEQNVAELGRCVALTDDCADVCSTTLRVLSRPFGWEHQVTHRLLSACVRACTSCAEECERHSAHHSHCAICAKACRACVHACGDLLQAEGFIELAKLAGT